MLVNRMGRNPELTPALRERICELHAIEWRYNLGDRGGMHLEKNVK